MSFIDEVRAKRKKLADVLSDEDYSGIREIVEELYPDKAHFIYELLQNAEDTGANTVTFTLLPDRLLFEHNGRPFSEGDVWGITNIGKGTKKTDDEAIGRFGVGFKAVFAYTDTPRIWSPTLCFQISELVLPSQLPPIPELGKTTRFEFPFNNPKKATADAYAEVEDGLNELSETTLLFLSHIESIAWRISGKSSGEVLRIPHSDHHIEVLKQIEGKTTGSSHYLRFTKPVEGIEKQRIAIAFAMDLLPKVDSFTTKKPLAEQLRIVPANPGRVAVFFPAEKEISGLRFHLHAPFVPELSRASIKETTANISLYRQLASLAASSLCEILDLGLLTVNFLGVLPNPQDNIPSRYDGIRRAIITDMKEKPLTPTYFKGHAPAKTLLQAKAVLKTLLSTEDMELLVDHDNCPPKWAIAAAQKNSDVDRFIQGLEIREWDIEEFVDAFEQNANRKIYSHPENNFMLWFAKKSDEWHQRLYAYFYRELEPECDLERLEDLCIVRLSNGQYATAGKCFFPTEEACHDENFPRVSRAIYTSGNSKAEQESARKLLEALGVRQVGEADEVEGLLKKSYRFRSSTLKVSKSDLSRFIAFVEKEPSHAELFKDYCIFQREDDRWVKPGQIYLDAPYLDTGLSAYYKAFGEKADRAALSENYQDASISIKSLVEFVIKTGAVSELKISEASCRKNPDVFNLVFRAPGSETAYKIDRDYEIVGLDQLLERDCAALSLLVWRTCAHRRYPDWTKAQYRSNRNHYPYNEAPSQLAVLLRSKRWIPQRGGTFVCPAEAARELLPDGFEFDSGWSWLKAIQFGESATRRSAESLRKREVAQELGFNDEESLNDGRKFAELDPEERRKFFADRESRHHPDLPHHEPNNPERRTNRVQEEAAEAPERRSEKRSRSVSVGRETVKKDTDPYLREQYTNNDGETICQVCKAALPFKLADGAYYLEAVEFLPELHRRHYQNYLALCPNHAAMFEHANGSRDMIMDLFLDIEGSGLDVILAEENYSIYFTKTHIIDIKAIISADDTGNGEE